MTGSADHGEARPDPADHVARNRASWNEWAADFEARPIPPFDDIVALEWARRWPCEEVWKARKRP